jgi:hypothetical protein
MRIGEGKRQKAKGKRQKSFEPEQFDFNVQRLEYGEIKRFRLQLLLPFAFCLLPFAFPGMDPPPVH